MKYLTQIFGNRAFVRIREHDVFHMSPPLPASISLGNLLPQLFRLNLGISKQPVGFPIKKYRVVVDTVTLEHLLQFGPDRVVTRFVLSLILRLESHDECFAYHEIIDSVG